MEKYLKLMSAMRTFLTLAFGEGKVTSAHSLRSLAATQQT
ncbi:hypothetical protein CPS_1623 [Colwellia psychrerythraea 34H]|uniref:Uncharacterized protein n=1 Tax=Colwellia psychrerythraea (strain 34H / ATCC BAA-681) TaxID=167879 RepID=Q485A4_COLP3|nr:hypothetical protein CPS_1623 [Colwellia psychrerythraea 34H]